MVIQNVIFPDEVCGIGEMYFRIYGNYEMKGCPVELRPGDTLSTDTYMNILDIGYWKKYTQLEMIVLNIRAEGRYKIRFFNVCDKKTNILLEEEVTDCGKGEIAYTLPAHMQEGFFYFQIEAREKTFFYSAMYTTETISKRKVRMAVDICTFHRNKQLRGNLLKFAESSFFDKKSELYGKLKVYVIDNGDDFYFPGINEGIEICRNSNRGGGTGGFTRGLEEIKAHYDGFPCTHTVFMDDDVEFQMESFYRLYAFFSLIKEGYADRSLAGRMFRLDQRNIQYTAVEKWNQGNIFHVGGNKDMSQREHVIEEKDLTGEYGGWWMCAYPAEISLKNKPFPFFIHCDDVEYGLRQKKSVLTLNGVQVWHETYEYRINPKIQYYDIRNPLAVNVMQGEFSDAEQLISGWKKRMTEYHNAGKQTEKYLCALALWHFGRGCIFGISKGKLSGFHMRVSKKEKLLEVITPVFYRIAERYVRLNYKKIVERYKKSREESIWQ